MDSTAWSYSGMVLVFRCGACCDEILNSSGSSSNCASKSSWYEDGMKVLRSNISGCSLNFTGFADFFAKHCYQFTSSDEDRGEEDLLQSRHRCTFLPGKFVFGYVFYVKLSFRKRGAGHKCMEKAAGGVCVLLHCRLPRYCSTPGASLWQQVPKQSSQASNRRSLTC